MNIEIDASENRIVIENLDRITRRASNMRPVFGKIASTLKKSHEMNFDMYGARFGSKWAARKHSYRHPLLHKTGTLGKSFHSNYDNGSATIENTASYAKHHQLGTRKMVARPIVGWADSDINEAIRIIRKNILEV